MLFGKTYVPILHARSVEIKALAELPGISKDLIFPLIIARPWPNAKHLAKTWEKLKAALGTRRFALDVDPSKPHSDGKQPAAAEFDALFDPADGHKAYFDELIEIHGAIPTLQLSPAADIAKQLQHAADLDRGLVLRLQYGRSQLPWRAK